MEDWGNFLHRILKEDSKDSAPIKMFLLVWGFGGKQRQLVAATGGHGWWRKREEGTRLVVDLGLLFLTRLETDTTVELERGALSLMGEMKRNL